MKRLRARKVFLATLGAASSAPLVGMAADTYTLRMSVPEPAVSAFGIAAIRFAQAVDRRTNHQVKVEVYPSGQLATQLGAIDGLTSGVVDFTIEAASFAVTQVPRLQVLDMPFLFKDLQTGLRVLDGPIGAELFADLEAKGILGLAYGINGLKQLETVSKVIATPADMKGVRIRTQGSVFNATYSTFGAIPIAIDLSETYSALQQKTIEAIDLPVDIFTTAKFYVPCKHMAMSNHVLSVIPLFASKKKMESLPAPLQKNIREAAKEIVPGWREYIIRQAATDIDLLKKNGVTINSTEYNAFRKAVEPVYAAYQSKIEGNLIERTLRAAAG